MDSDLGARLGFRLEGGGTHAARTIMLAELRELLASVTDPHASRERYRSAIESENCLGKRSRMTRSLSYRHLAQLYALDRDVLLFRALRFLWSRDADGQPLIALLCAYARDPILRATAALVLCAGQDTRVGLKETRAEIEKRHGPGLSPATLASTAQNVLASWTKSGHLTGVRTKRRSRAKATAGAAGYALLMGYLSGARGQGLFQTEYCRLLDCPTPVAMELAAEASRRGWLVFKRVADVVEVLFPSLIPAREREWLREQA